VATTMFAKLVSLYWGMLCVGRRKMRLLTAFAAGTLMCLASVGATPQSAWGGWLFVGQVALAQVFLTGVITVRSALWKANYPTSFRAQITARLQLIRLLPSIAAMTAAGFLFDRDPLVYRFVYPVVALCGASAVVILQRMHVRGESADLRRVPNGGDPDLGRGLAEPFSLATMLSPGHVVSHMFRVLRGDRRFAQYCGALALTGAGNLLVPSVLVVIVTQNLALGYVSSFILLEILHRATMMIALYRWAPYYDRVGVVRFRVVTGLCWLSFLVLGLIGTLVLCGQAAIGPVAPVIAALLYGLSSIAKGLGMGGGALAWNLGHLHFAQPKDAEVYMGVHVTLTGLRGLTMPFLGIWLWALIGWWVWLLAVLLSIAGLVGYILMAKTEAATGQPENAQTHSAPAAQLPR
ncbi:MAG: hypothetical protein GY778_04885, partial [bacterium]|nr:hypothetical protein [bacterium]